MTNITSAEEFIKRKNGGVCSLCGVPHKPEVQCNRAHLANRIVKLLEANSMIPTILKHNSEAVELNSSYQMMIRKFDESHTILMELLQEHGEEGAEISAEYMKRLDAWVQGKERTNQDTSDQPSLFSPEPSTQNVTAISGSTNPPSGSPSESDS